LLETPKHLIQLRSVERELGGRAGGEVVVANHHQNPSSIRAGAAPTAKTIGNKTQGLLGPGVYLNACQNSRIVEFSQALSHSGRHFYFFFSFAL
jgi:hypothetical protein